MTSGPKTPTTPSAANTIQIGGSHYKAKHYLEKLIDLESER